MNDTNKWLRIRKDLYLQMEKEVRFRLGEDTPELESYRLAYEKEFSKKWIFSDKESLWEQASQSQILLMGDFHALHQSQKTHLRVLRHLVTVRPVVLAVEFFESQHQSFVDQYLEGKISEKLFLQKTHWYEKWGFPWEHYKPILEFAKKNKIPVRGINKSFSQRNGASLKARDVFGAACIRDICKQYPEALIVVIYGDLHLAQGHLYYEIEKIMGKSVTAQTLRLFLNSDLLYFKVLKKDPHAHSEIVRISKNAFCLLNVAPWVKLQNYLMYLEKTYDVGLVGEDEEDLEDDATLDLTDHVGRYVQIISEELGVVVSNSRLSVFTAEDSAFWDQVAEHFDVRRRKQIQTLIGEERSFCLPEIGVCYLARSTVNHAASLAMLFVYAEVTGQKSALTVSDKNFEALIWQEGLAYFGSKIINSQRKADTLLDLKSVLAGSGGEAGQGREALKLALSQKMQELLVITGAKKKALRLKPKQNVSFLRAAGLLGGMLGERLYFGYRNKKLSLKNIQKYLRLSSQESDFAENYYENLKVIETFPVPFVSKKEKL